MNNKGNMQSVTIIDKMLGFKDIARGIRENILAGEIDSLDAMIALKSIKKAIETIEKDNDVSESVMRHFDMYNEKSVDLRYATVTIKDTGVKYDFSVCNDEEYNNLMAEQEELTARIKDRQEFLKRLPETGLDCFNHDTGEVYTIHRPLRLANQTLEYKFKQ